MTIRSSMELGHTREHGRARRIEERPVPASDVPGEELSPTQPFPTKPPPFEHQGVTEDDLIDFTPELHAQALAIAREFRFGGMFNPPSLNGNPDGTNGSFHAPGANGGANIPGGSSVDPETGILYVASERGHSVIQLVPGSESVQPSPSCAPEPRCTSTATYVSMGPGESGGRRASRSSSRRTARSRPSTSRPVSSCGASRTGTRPRTSRTTPRSRGSTCP